MKNLAAVNLCLGCVLAVSTSHAIDLKQSKVTQVVNDVQIISAANQQQKNAAVNDIFSMPDILRTGPASRAELVAADETVTRVGANTIFSFDPATRTIDLQQGSLLFHSPHGMGGGTIHTGSATASVLGTTLIVTTTPSGGMKVLDLEGSVEVKFLSGLKQNLAPGHMTFVLPGGKQLAPIIVFRLDDLTKNSLLVNGFNQNLASMPLIQQQIDKQLKLIATGKLSDTGLLVGNDANSQGVQTLGLDTLQAALDQSSINPPAVTAAFGSDAYINNSSLDSSRIFPGVQIVIPRNKFYNAKPFEGFVARNIYFNTINENPLYVNLTPYGTWPEFDFLAGDNITIDGSVDFYGLASTENSVFSLVAGKQITVAAGSTIEADVANFYWQTPDNLTLNGVYLKNDIGNTFFGLGGNFTVENAANFQLYADLSVTTPGNITINNSTIGADSMFLTSANGTIGVDSSYVGLNNFGVLTAKKTITIHNSVFNGNLGTGLLRFNSISGSVNITGTSIQTGSLNVNAGNGILLDGSDQTYTLANGSFAAKSLITLNNVNFNNVAYFNAAANTITVSGANFNPGNIYNFGTKTGNANFGTVVYGELNLINDKLGNATLNNVSQVNLTSGPSNAHGINSYKN